MMTTASPPGYSRLFATGLFLSTEIPVPSASAPPSGSRSATPTPASTAPQTPMLEFSATLAIPTLASRPVGATSSSSVARRPKLAALRTHSAKSVNSTSGPPSAGGAGSNSVPASPRVKRRKSSVTLAHNPIAAIKSPTRSAGMSGRAQTVLQALGSPTKDTRRAWSLDIVGERSMEGLESDVVSLKSARARRPVVARKPPPTVPLPALPVQPPLLTLPAQPPFFALPTLTLNTSFPSPMTLSPALTPSPNILPAPTPGAIDLGLHKFSFANHKLAPPRPARSPLVSVPPTNAGPGYFDVPIMRPSSPVLPENEMDVE